MGSAYTQKDESDRRNESTWIKHQKYASKHTKRTRKPVKRVISHLCLQKRTQFLSPCLRGWSIPGIDAKQKEPANRPFSYRFVPKTRFLLPPSRLTPPMPSPQWTGQQKTENTGNVPGIPRKRNPPCALESCIQHSNLFLYPILYPFPLRYAGDRTVLFFGTAKIDDGHRSHLFTSPQDFP